MHPASPFPPVPPAVPFGRGAPSRTTPGREGTPAMLAVRTVVVLALVVAAASAIGLVIVHGLEQSALVRTDLDVERSLAEGRTDLLDRLTGWATWLSDTVPVAVLWAALVAASIRWTRHWVAPVAVMTAVSGEKLSYLLTSIVVDRPRPPVPPLGVVHATTSFPSGHTASAVSMYGVVVLLAVWSGHLRRPAGRWAAGAAVALVAAVVGFARMYRGHHYPSDVVAGALLGATWLVVTWLLVLRDRPPTPAGQRGQPASSRS